MGNKGKDIGSRVARFLWKVAKFLLKLIWAIVYRILLLVFWIVTKVIEVSASKISDSIHGQLTGKKK